MNMVWHLPLVLMLAVGMGSSLSLAQTGLGAVKSQEGEGARVFLLGFVQEGEAKLGILGWEGLVFLVREGDTILGTYRVEWLGEDVAILRDGEAEIRASFRPKQPDTVASRLTLPTALSVGDGWLPSADQGPPGSPSSDAGTTPSAMAATPGGGGLAPASSTGAAASGGGAVQGQEENPFIKALRERGQTPFASASPDNPFIVAAQQDSSVWSDEENPFLRAIRERGSALSPPEDNPFLRALRERGH